MMASEPATNRNELFKIYARLCRDSRLRHRNFMSTAVMLPPLRARSKRKNASENRIQHTGVRINVAGFPSDFCILHSVSSFFQDQPAVSGAAGDARAVQIFEQRDGVLAPHGPPVFARRPT